MTNQDNPNPATYPALSDEELVAIEARVLDHDWFREGWFVEAVPRLIATVRSERQRADRWEQLARRSLLTMADVLDDWQPTPATPSPSPEPERSWSAQDRAILEAAREYREAWTHWYEGMDGEPQEDIRAAWVGVEECAEYLKTVALGEQPSDPELERANAYQDAVHDFGQLVREYIRTGEGEIDLTDPRVTEILARMDALEPEPSPPQAGTGTLDDLPSFGDYRRMGLPVPPIAEPAEAGPDGGEEAKE